MLAGRKVGLQVGGVLVAERESAEYFETVAKARDGKLAANWVINELFGRLNKEGRGIEDSPVSADQLGGIIDLIGEKVISGKIAKDLFEIVWSEGGDPRAIVEARRQMLKAPWPLPVMVAIAHQCFNTEYVFEESAEERGKLGELRAAILKRTGEAEEAHDLLLEASARLETRRPGTIRWIGCADSGLIANRSRSRFAE